MSSEPRATIPLATLRDPAFTPRRQDVPLLVELVAGGSDEEARAASHALARVQSAVAYRIVECVDTRSAAARARLVDALRLRLGHGEDDAIADELERFLADEEPRVRKAALRALGKLGGRRAAEAAARASATESGAVARAAARAAQKLRKDAARAPLSSLRADASLGGPHPIAFLCRRGLEPVVIGEIAERLGVDASAAAPGRVLARAAAPLAELARVRTALRFAFVVEAPLSGDDPDLCLAELLAAAPARRIFEVLTSGPVRYRLAWDEPGKKRGRTRTLTRRLDELTGGAILDDPRAATWDVSVRIAEGVASALLAPRVEDARFAYRRGAVPASSHPTVAAALARVAGARPGDVVWDPFVGSGLELCERALLGPYARLIGTDVDARAVTEAQRNLAAAGAHDVELFVSDARAADVRAVTLVLTNPPMGRRLVRGPALDKLLGETLTHIASRLARNGRVVLLSARPRVTREAATAAGLAVVRERVVDLGGFEVMLQHFSWP